MTKSPTFSLVNFLPVWMSLDKPDFESEDNHSLTFDVPEISDKVVFVEHFNFQYSAIISLY